MFRLKGVLLLFFQTVLTMLLAKNFRCFFIITMVMILAVNTTKAQHSLELTIVNKTNTIAVVNAHIILSGADVNKIGVTDSYGTLIFNTLSDTIYTVTVSHLGFDTFRTTLVINKNRVVKVGLQPNRIDLNNIVLTAKGTKKQSGSIIDRNAIEHLQPSSFTDLLALLPGGTSKDPVFSAANHIRLREVGILGNDYNSSSMGVGFLVDGHPIGTDANMQYTSGPEITLGPDSYYADRRRNSVNKGVDMRSIITDQIKTVEIVRGLPSVVNGNISSGLVKIERKNEASPLEARFKGDGNSKLFYIGKGYAFNKHTLTFGGSFLNATPNAVSNYENYKRVTASVLHKAIWNGKKQHWIINTSIDYSQNIDSEKTDPDIDLLQTDSYKSTYNRIGFSNASKLLLDTGFVKSIELLTSVNQSFDKIEQTRLIQLQKLTAIPITTTAGANDGIYIQPKYISRLKVDGKPLYANIKLIQKNRINLGKTNHKIVNGLEWNYSKNFGDGQVYDPLLPPSTAVTRPRKYHTIPASQKIAFFLEDQIEIPFSAHKLLLNVGARLSSLLNIGKQFDLHKKWHFAPRASLQWSFPKFLLGDKKAEIAVIGSVGRYIQYPSLEHLYPELNYVDFTQFNYYHTNSAYRKVNYRTHIINTTNNKLKPIENKKYEISLNATLSTLTFNVTFFKELMDTGIRSSNHFKTLDYNDYQEESIAHDMITSAPSLTNIPFTKEERHVLYGIYSNGSAISKQGIEVDFRSKRIKSLNTRFSFNGAWFKTTYNNSLSEITRGKKDVVLNGKPLPFLGVYNSIDGSVKERIATSLFIDSYIVPLSLIVSANLESTWLLSSQSLPTSGTPVSYIGLDGVQHAYTAKDKKDGQLQWLNSENNPKRFIKRSSTTYSRINLRLSKKFYQKFKVSMFVNKLFTFKNSNKDSDGRITTSPYFGMELNIYL